MIIFSLKESYYFGTSSVTKAFSLSQVKTSGAVQKCLALHNVSQGQYADDHMLLFSILQFQHGII